MVVAVVTQHPAEFRWPLDLTVVFPDMALAMQAAMVTGRRSTMKARPQRILVFATQTTVGRENGANIPTHLPATAAGRWTPSRVLAPADSNRALIFPISGLIAVSQIWKHAAGTAAFNETAPASARLDSAGSIANAQTARMALGVRSATQGILRALFRKKFVMKAAVTLKILSVMMVVPIQ